MMVVCASASDNVIPTMVIGERLNHNPTKGEVPSTLHGLSENGWIDHELFFFIGLTTTLLNTYHPHDQFYCFWMATQLTLHLRQFRSRRSRVSR